MTKNNLSEEELAQLYSLGRDDFMVYSVLTNPNYVLNWHLKEIAKSLQDAEQYVKEKRERQLFIIIEAPPRHGKSEMVSKNFPAWFIGRNPEFDIITASYSGELSKDFGAATRNLVKSVEHQCVFPESDLSEDTKAKGRWMTNQGGSYTSVGVGGTITGRGAHLLIIDDPHKDRAESDSLHMRNHVWSWFTSTAYSRLEPNGVVILIMQRWNLDDLVGRIEREFGNRADIEIRRLTYQAIAEVDEEHRQRGEALMPARYDIKDLMRIQGVQGLINFSSQYQQRPILQKDQTFKQEYFRYFEEEDITNKDLVYTTTMDLAVGAKENLNGDYVAIITVGKERLTNKWYIVDCCIDKLDPLQCCDYLFQLYLKYRMSNVGIETNAYQKTFKFWLQEEQKRRNIFMPLQEIRSKTDKEARIRGLVGYYQTGMIFHRKNYFLLESQLLNFPQDQHDDGPDALAMQLEVQIPTGSSGEALVQAAREHVERVTMNQVSIPAINKTALIDRYRQVSKNVLRKTF